MTSCVCVAKMYTQTHTQTHKYTQKREGENATRAHAVSPYIMPQTHTYTHTQ